MKAHNVATIVLFVVLIVLGYLLTVWTASLTGEESPEHAGAQAVQTGPATAEPEHSPAAEPAAPQALTPSPAAPAEAEGPTLTLVAERQGGRLTLTLQVRGGTLALTGWRLSDAQGESGDGSHLLYFPRNQVLREGEPLVIHGGCGRNRAGELYWCLDQPLSLWEAAGTTLFLRDARGQLAFTCVPDERDELRIAFACTSRNRSP